LAIFPSDTYLGKKMSDLTPQEMREFREHVLRRGYSGAGDAFGYDGQAIPTMAQRQASMDFMHSAKVVKNIGRALLDVNMPDGARDAVFEVVIAQTALRLASVHGDLFDSFKFSATCKGRSE
jgi:hypothetical protein